MSATELLASFFFTWLILLGPPALIRLVRKKPLTNKVTIAILIALYFVNIILFTALGSTNKSHGAVMLGAFFSYFVLRWQTKSSADRQAADERKKLGYD